MYLVTSASKLFIQHSSQSPDNSPEVLPDCLSPLLAFWQCCLQPNFFLVMLCDIFPDQGLNPSPLQWKCTVWTTGLPGKSTACNPGSTMSVLAAWASQLIPENGRPGPASDPFSCRGLSGCSSSQKLCSQVFAPASALTPPLPTPAPHTSYYSRFPTLFSPECLW